MPSDELPHTPYVLSYSQPSSEHRSVDLRCHGVGGGKGGGEGGGDGGGGDGGGGEGGGGDGGGGDGGGDGGGGDGGGGDGGGLGGLWYRLPQSVQSLPYSHKAYADPGPPSSHPPSDAMSIPLYVLRTRDVKSVRACMGAQWV